MDYRDIVSFFSTSSCDGEKRSLASIIPDKYIGDLNNSISKFQKLASPSSLANKTIIGHRGCGEKKYNKKQPENTLKSFKQAFKMGANMVELDIHLTTDDAIVIHHDFDINGTLIYDINKVKFIEEMEAAGKTPTMLEDVLKVVPDGCGIDIEIKSPIAAFSYRAPSNYFPRLCRALLRLLLDYPDVNIILSSFDLFATILLKHIFPSLKTFQLFSHNSYFDFFDCYNSFDDNESVFTFLCNFSSELYIDGLILDTELIDTKYAFLKKVCKSGVVILCYGDGTNYVDGAKSLLYDFGVSGLITDRLDEILNIEKFQQK